MEVAENLRNHLDDHKGQTKEGRSNSTTFIPSPTNCNHYSSNSKSSSYHNLPRLHVNSTTNLNRTHRGKSHRLHQTKVFCCCGAKTWSQFIGYFNVVCAVVLLILTGFFYKPINNQNSPHVISGSTNLTGKYMQGFLLLLLGCILLYGVYGKKQVLVGIWLIANGIMLACFVVSGGIYLLEYWGEYGSEIWWIILISMVLMSIQFFFIYVVNTFRKEYARKFQNQSNFSSTLSLFDLRMTCGSTADIKAMQALQALP